MVASVTTTSGSSTASTAAATSAASATAESDRFLKLLVAQMKNQDPLNPMDNAQVTTQMAQISTVSGIEKLNSTLESFSKAQSLQGVNMIGHEVLAPGNFINLSSGAAAAGFDLPSKADSVSVNVLDSSGNVVRKLDLGAKDTGVSTFSWDGKNTDGTALADGTYSFQVAATASGKTVVPTALAVGTVVSVIMDSTGSSLSVTGMGKVDVASVRQIL